MAPNKPGEEFLLKVIKIAINELTGHSPKSSLSDPALLLGVSAFSGSSPFGRSGNTSCKQLTLKI